MSIDYLSNLPSVLQYEILDYFKDKEIYNNICKLSKYWANLIYAQNKLYLSNKLDLDFQSKDEDKHEEDDSSNKYDIESYLSFVKFASQTDFQKLKEINILHCDKIDDIFNIIDFRNVINISLSSCSLDVYLFKLLPLSLVSLKIIYPIIPDTDSVVEANNLKNLKSLHIIAVSYSVLSILIPPSNLESFIFEMTDCEEEDFTLIPFMESLSSLKFLELKNCCTMELNRDYDLPPTLESLSFSDCDDYFVDNLSQFPKSLTYINLKGMNVNLIELNECENLIEMHCFECMMIGEDNAEINRLLDVPPLPPNLTKLTLNDSLSARNLHLVPSLIEFSGDYLHLNILIITNGFNLKSLTLNNCDIDNYKDDHDNTFSFKRFICIEKFEYDDSSNSLPMLELPSSIIEFSCKMNNLKSIFVGNSLKNDINISSSEFLFVPKTITKLNCSGNNISNFNVNLNSLQFLDLSGNKLKNYPTLPESLTELYLNECDLNFLDYLPSKLITLSCYSNNIKEFPYFPDSLQTLDITFNPASKIRNFPTSLKILETSINLSLNLFLDMNIKNLPTNLAEFNCDCGSISLEYIALINRLLKHIYEINNNKSLDISVIREFNSILSLLSKMNSFITKDNHIEMFDLIMIHIENRNK